MRPDYKAWAYVVILSAIAQEMLRRVDWDFDALYENSMYGKRQLPEGMERWEVGPDASRVVFG